MDPAPPPGARAASAPLRTPLRRAVRQWFGPVGAPTTWRAAGYLAVGVLATWAWALVVGLVVLAAALAVCTVVGIPLAVPAFSLVAVLAGVERSRARLVGTTIPARPLDDGPGLWRRARVRLADRARWRQIAYHLSAWAVVLVLTLVALVAWAVALYLVSLPAWGWSVGLGMPTAALLAVVGVAFSGLAARVTRLCARLGAEYTAWLLGADRLAAMRSQVEHLTADRRLILDAVAGERRRIERNLHDGVQPRLVALGIDLGMAEAMLPQRPEEARELVASARERALESIGELRVIGRGLHPSILEHRGLDAALSAVVADAPVPVELRCDVDAGVPPLLEEAAYFIVSEAVSNILKHSRARAASVDVVTDDGRLCIVVRDDGVGGATTGRGSGLDGIEARVRGLDGTLRISSPTGGPSVVSVELPIRPDARGSR